MTYICLYLCSGSAYIRSFAQDTELRPFTAEQVNSLLSLDSWETPARRLRASGVRISSWIRSSETRRWIRLGRKSSCIFTGLRQGIGSVEGVSVCKTRSRHVRYGRQHPGRLDSVLSVKEEFPTGGLEYCKAQVGRRDLYYTVF
ncbi:hypothetical protein PMAC_000586 [Pneumocystis sp. 'macacae']|nr:hypothetical protein PMAC_000586 [Pneumocystis sp. 'macacae']